MKILSIRIKNLASLAGEHFIDFESQPLAGAGLIAIVGKTGAGKSTILDAMCLALFNQIPRLKGSEGKVIDNDGTPLKTDSPLTVLRRGTSEGFAELSFVANDKKRYMVYWEVRRARNKSDGKLKATRWLKCLTDGVIIANTTTSVDEKVYEITQLKFGQFTRAVLLAQSEVTAFLKSRDNERGELLEYLTNSSIFGKIGQLAFEKTRDIANQRKALEARLGDIELLSEEDFTTFNAQLDVLNTEHQKLDIEKATLQKQQQWYEQKQKFETNLQARQQNLQSQQQQLNTLAPQKVQLQQLERFASIRPYIIQNKNFSDDLEKLQPLLEKAQQEFDTVDQQYTAKKLSFEKIEAEQKLQHQFEVQHQEKIKLVRDRIAERLVLVEQLRQAQTELKDLEVQLIPHQNNEIALKQKLEQIQHNLAQNTAQLEQSNYFALLDDALPAHINQVQRFIQSYTQFEKNYGDVQKANEQLSTQQQQLESLTQQFGQDDVLNQKITTLRIEREQLLQKINQLNIIQHQWQNFQNIDVEYSQLSIQKNSLTQQIEQTHAQLKTAETAYQDNKNSREQLQQMLQHQRLLNAENIEKLRADLMDGEACLVCGSTHHPYAEKGAFSDELLNLQKQQEQQVLESEKLAFDAWQKLQTTFTQQTASLDSNLKQLETLTTQLQQAQNSLQQQLNILNLSFDFSEDHQTLMQLIQMQIKDAQHTQKQLEEALSSHESAQKQRLEVVQFIQQTKQHLSVVQQAEINIQQIIGVLKESEKQAWTQNTLNTAEHIYNCLQQRQNIFKHLNELNAQQTQITQQLIQCEQELKFCQEKIQSVQNRINNLTSEGQKNRDIAIQAIFEMTENQVEKPHEWLMQFDQNRQTVQHEFNTARQKFDQLRQTFETTQSRLKECLTQQAQLHTHIKHVQKTIQDWLSKHTEFNVAVLEQLSSIIFEQEQQLKQRVSEVERAYADTQAGIKTIEEQLKKHLEHQPKFELDALNAALTSLSDNITILLEQRDLLKFKVDYHNQNITQQQKFAEQILSIQTEEHRWNKISSLMGDSTGKKFRDYAQQYNLDILLEYANQQLAMLSQRYTLKRLDNSLSLAIVDHDMDGETRSVSSLSGGESFLTALALSLAIANMASGSMKIESLFIDEGFGTLDASSLHMVMNALDQLQSQGRKVVLISHIQDMHERIPVQIQVQPVGAGASRIEVVG